MVGILVKTVDRTAFGVPGRDVSARDAESPLRVSVGEPGQPGSLLRMPSVYLKTRTKRDGLGLEKSYPDAVSSRFPLRSLRLCAQCFLPELRAEAQRRTQRRLTTH